MPRRQRGCSSRLGGIGLREPHRLARSCSCVAALRSGWMMPRSHVIGSTQRGAQTLSARRVDAALDRLAGGRQRRRLAERPRRRVAQHVCGRAVEPLAHHVGVDEAEVGDAHAGAGVGDLRAEAVARTPRRPPWSPRSARASAGAARPPATRSGGCIPGARSTCGSAARTVRHTPSRFTSIVRSNATGSIVATVPNGAMPALAITTSMPPKRSTVASTARLQRVPVGHVRLEPGRVVRRSPRRPARSSSGSRPTSDTCAPRFASRRAASAPIPRAAPVISTTLSRTS